MHPIETTLIVVGATLAGARLFAAPKSRSQEESAPAQISIKGALAGFTLSNLFIYVDPLKGALRAKEGMKVLAVTSSAAMMLALGGFVGSSIMKSSKSIREAINKFSTSFYNASPEASDMVVVAGCAAASLAFGNFIASAVSR